MAELNVNILSPAKIVAKTTANQVQAPGVVGYFGVLPGHAKMVAELATGKLTVESGAGTQSFFVAGGYVDVADDHVMVLVDVIEKPEEIDRARAEKALKRAEDRLNPTGPKEAIDLMRAQAAMKRAQARLQVAASK